MPPADPSPSPPAPAAPDTAERLPLGLRVTAAWSWRLLVIAGVVGLVLALLVVLRLLVFAFVAALFITALLRPFALRLRRWGLGEKLAGVLAVLGFLALLAAIIAFVSYSVSHGMGDLRQSVVDGWAKIRDWLATGPLNLNDADLAAYGERIRASFQNQQSGLAAGALHSAATAAEVVTGTVLALVITIFLVADGDQIGRWSFTLLPQRARGNALGAGHRAWETFSGYVRGVVAVAFVDAIGIGAGAAIIGVPLAVPIALVTFLGAFVPIVGATVAGVIAVLVALVASGLTSAIIMAAVVLAVQQLEAHILQPFLLGRAVRVHPLGIILAVTAGGIIAGIGGTVIAVPLVAVVKVVIIHYAHRNDPSAVTQPEAGPDTAPEPARS